MVVVLSDWAERVPISGRVTAIIRAVRDVLKIMLTVELKKPIRGIGKSEGTQGIQANEDCYLISDC